MIERMLCKVEGFVFGVTMAMMGMLAWARYLDIQQREREKAKSEEGGDATHYANGQEFHINGCDGD